MSTATATAPRAPTQALERNDWVVRGLCLAYALAAFVALVLPLGTLLRRSLLDAKGNYVGLRNYAAYFDSPALLESFGHSVFVSGLTSLIVVPLALAYALALTRTAMRGKTLFRAVALVPLLIPGIVKAIALIYLFGNQGLLKSFLMGESIYGPIGIVAASVLWTFPHAMLITLAALLHSDQRLYQAAQALRTNRWRTFVHVTWPGCRYGVIAAFLVVFVSVFTDFGVAKVIGGRYNVLATDIYKEVIGQQNFEMGAVISMMLLIPAVGVFVLERLVARRQMSQVSGRSVPFEPVPHRRIDILATVYCSVIALVILGILGMAQFAALVKFWPYNLSLTLANYVFQIEGIGWENFGNSLKMALATATLGTAVTFLGAYLVEKPRRDGALRRLLEPFMLVPMAVPGLVLGLAYLMFINIPGNPLGVLYGGMAILVVNTLTHLYSVPHLTCMTALKSIDREVEAVSASLRTPVWRSFLRVTLPVCLPALLDVWIYLFLGAMTTLSGVIFLYATETKLAAIAVIHIDETGRVASAAAMAMLIVYACVFVRLLHVLVSRYLLHRLQGWRVRTAAA